MLKPAMILLVLATALLAILPTGCSDETTPTLIPNPSDTPAPTPTATPISVPADTSIPSPVPTSTPTPAQTATATPAATPVPALADTPTPTPFPSPVPTSTPTATQTATPTPVPTATPTATPTQTATPTSTPTPIPNPSIQSFAAIPLTIEDGDSSTLDWTTTGASSVTVSGVTGPLPVDGRTVVRPAATTTYTLTATNEVGTEVSKSVTITVTYPIVSLDVNGTTILSSIGRTSQLSVTASRSDGSSHVVDNSLVEWGSSDPWVASVSEGLVTAVGGGKTVIHAAYQGLTAEMDVSVRISRRSTGTVRVLYAIPSDREFLPEASETIADIMVDLQSWYRRELRGLTFSVYEIVPEVCRMSEPEDFYARGDAWKNVVEGVQHCGPVQQNSPGFVWVLYVDVMEPCDETHELGAGGAGLTILGDVRDGFVRGSFYFCGEGPYYRTSEQWIGGLGHELGHALGLPHPPGCDAGLPTCDREALMGSGNYVYPETYLRADNKEVLIRSPFIGTEPVPGRDPDDVANASSVSGVAYGTGGQPLQGIRVSLVGEDFWNWGETGGDGSFVIPVPEGVSGSSLLSVHAGEAGECRWLGYHGPDGITTAQPQATRVEIGGGNVSGIEIRLPAIGNNPCLGERKVAGVVLGPDEKPVEGIWLGAWLGTVGAWVRSGEDGTFEFSVPEGWVGSPILRIHADEVPHFPDCGIVGFYGPGGFTTWPEEASLEIGGIGAPGLEIRLPASPDELCRGQTVVAGTVLGPDDEPVEGFRIGLIDAEPRGFWPRKWGETGPDGTFEIRLLAGQFGSFVVGVYADEEEISIVCNQLGFYGPSGFTTVADDATQIEAGRSDVKGIEIGLPASTDQLLPERVGGYYCGE